MLSLPAPKQLGKKIEGNRIVTTLCCTVSGTALIRPDFPELLTFPYLWQQVEYVLGGGSSHYMFLVLAARDLLGQ